MSKRVRVAAACLAAMFATEGSWAADRCASHEEMTTLKVAALQQQLMVAALTCHETRAYNRFVLSYRPELQRSDHAMLSLFLRKGDGDAAYNAYKTRLANLSVLENNADSDAFCSDARAAFDAARENDSLESFVATQRISARLPF